MPRSTDSYQDAEGKVWAFDPPYDDDPPEVWDEPEDWSGRDCSWSDDV